MSKHIPSVLGFVSVSLVLTIWCNRPIDKDLAYAVLWAKSWSQTTFVVLLFSILLVVLNWRKNLQPSRVKAVATVLLLLMLAGLQCYLKSTYGGLSSN